MSTTVDRDEVLAMLASYGDRPASAVRDRIDSLELAWLVHQAEQRYGVTLDLTDEELGGMSTVDGAVVVLRERLRGAPGVSEERACEPRSERLRGAP